MLKLTITTLLLLLIQVPCSANYQTEKPIIKSRVCPLFDQGATTGEVHRYISYQIYLTMAENATNSTLRAIFIDTANMLAKELIKEAVTERCPKYLPRIN